LVTKYFDLLFSPTFSKMDPSQRQATHPQPARLEDIYFDMSDDFSRQMDGCEAKKGMSEQNSPGRIFWT